MQKKVVFKMLIFIVLFNIFPFGYTREVEALENSKFNSITVEDGLSQGTVETLLQDSQGYIWIGTNDGLDRYNGYNIKSYRKNISGENSLVNNYIVTLNEDEKGNIWVGTINGISKINKKGNIITNYTKEESGLSNNNITEILISNTGKIYVATADGLNVYNEELDRFERILNDRLTSEEVYSISEDDNGNLWIGTLEGLNRYNFKNDKIKTYNSSDSENGISEDTIYKVFCDKNDIVWIGTFDSGICKLNSKTGKITNYQYDSKNKNSLPSNFVTGFLRDSRDNLWVTTGEGIAQLDESNNTFKIYKKDVYDRYSLIDDRAYTIMEDASGLIWIGTYSGISVIDINNKIEHYKKEPKNNNSLSEDMINAVYEDKDGLLWVGTNSKGIDIIDRNKDKVVRLGDLGYLKNKRILSIVGREEKIFIGTDAGLGIIDKKKKLVEIIDQSNGLVDKRIRSLYVDSKGYLWIGTTSGLNILNIEDNSIIDVSDIIKESLETDTYIGAIYEDSKGIYWIGSMVSGGLTKINSETKEIKNYKHDKNDSNTISDNSIRTITEDSKGSIYVGTSLGLNIFDRDSEIFKYYSMEDGLPNNTIYGILLDQEENPWMSTNNGISKLDIKTEEFKNFNTNDGLQGNEFNGNAYYKNSRGEFFFGGVNGLNIFNPEEIIHSAYNGQVVFDEFKVNGLVVNNIQDVKLKFTENNITVQVFLPEYRNNGSIQYYYTLDNPLENEEWIKMDSNKVTLINMFPGDYTLRIKAKNTAGVYSKEAIVEFRIKTSFLISKEAILIYILMLCIYFYYIKNKVRILDALVDERSKKLNREMVKNNELLNKIIQLEVGKNNYLVNLSHELRTPLNVLYTTEQLIKELNKSEEGIEKEKLNTYMDVMRKNTKRLLKLINDLIDTTKIESGHYHLNIEASDIVYVVEEAALTLKEFAKGKGIELIVDPKIEEKIVECDSNEIERCIVNLVSNAIKFTPEGGKIEVVIKDFVEYVYIEVSDTGIGIDKKYHSTIFNRFKQVVDTESEVKGGSGLGLTITKHIVDLHDGSIKIDSEIGKGTTFKILLPVMKKKEN